MPMSGTRRRFRSGGELSPSCAEEDEIKSGASSTNRERQRGHLPDFPTRSFVPEMRWPQCGHMNLMAFISMPGAF